MTKARKSGLLGVIACVVVLGLLQNTNVIAMPVIADIIETFVPLGYDATTIFWFITIQNVGTCISPIAYSVIANKVSVKSVTIAGAAIIVVFGSAPALLGTNLPIMLVTRLLLGCGVGIIFSVSAVLINANMDEKSGAKWMGFVQLFAGIGMIFYQTVTGYIALIDWHLTMYLYAVSAVIVIVFLVCLKPQNDPGSDQFKASEGAVDARKTAVQGTGKLSFRKRFSLRVVIYWLFIFISVTGIFLFQANISVRVAAEALGTSVDAGLILSASTLTGIGGALIFGSVFNRIREWVMVLGAGVAGLSLVCCYFATDQILLYVGSGLLGIVAPMLPAACYQLAGRNAAPAAAAMAVSVSVVALNLGVILEPIWTTLILGAMGLDANGGRDPFLLGIALFIVMAIIATANALAAQKQERTNY